MSISLSNHEDRIKKLEDKVLNVNVIKEILLNNPGFVRFYNDLTIQWGTVGVKQNSNYPIQFPTPFKHSILSAVVTSRVNDVGGNGAWTPKIWSTTNLTHLVVSVDARNCSYIAIGY